MVKLGQTVHKMITFEQFKLVATAILNPVVRHFTCKYDSRSVKDTLIQNLREIEYRPYGSKVTAFFSKSRIWPGFPHLGVFSGGFQGQPLKVSSKGTNIQMTLLRQSAFLSH